MDQLIGSWRHLRQVRQPQDTSRLLARVGVAIAGIFCSGALLEGSSIDEGDS